MLYARSSTGRSLPAAGVHLRQRVQDRRRADPQPQVAGDQAEQVAGLQRGGPRQKAGQQLELAALRAGPFGAGDLVQCVDDCGDLQAWLPICGGRGQQLLGGLAEVAGLPHRGDDLARLDAGRRRDGAQRHLLGQAQVHPGELGRHLALAQIADGGQQLLRGLGQQCRQPVDQRQSAGSLLQVPVRLRDNLVLHPAIIAYPVTARPHRAGTAPRSPSPVLRRRRAGLRCRQPAAAAGSSALKRAHPGQHQVQSLAVITAAGDLLGRLDEQNAMRLRSGHAERADAPIDLSPKTRTVLGRQVVVSHYLLVPAETEPCSCRWKIK